MIADGESHREQQHRRLAELVKSACLAAAREAYEDAGVRGLCAEGCWEVALDAVASLDLGDVIAEAGTR